ncbi:hypothetical protein, partial [Helicobacter heilmannii]|uniref:hypothetical protein n=1 Tax=Helicobacter heilmannii TaxID=35817 RepID=UPI0009EC3089
MATHIKGLEVLDAKGNPKAHTKKHTPKEDKDAFKAILDQKKAHLNSKDAKAKREEKGVDHSKNPPHIAPNSPLAQLMDKKLTPKQEKELKKELKAQAKEEAKLQHFKNKHDPFSQAMALKGAKNAKNTPKSAKLSDIKNLESAKALNLSKLQHESKASSPSTLTKDAEPTPKDANAKATDLASKATPGASNLARLPQGVHVAKGATPTTPTPQGIATSTKMSTADLLALKNPPKKPTPTTEHKGNKDTPQNPPPHNQKLPINPKPKTPINHTLTQPNPTPHDKDSHDQ